MFGTYASIFEALLDVFFFKVSVFPYYLSASVFCLSGLNDSTSVYLCMALKLITSVID